ncbi:MAG TPA: EamA family transporter [Chitinophagaceae bacterium]|nr:EamA family transporter [Chitinophagaceae bacterium]
MITTLTHKEPAKSLVIAAFAAVYLIWGSTYVGIALAIKSVPPFLMAGLRFFAAGFILFAWCLATGEKVQPLASFVKSAFAGVLMLGVGTTALIWSEQYLPSGLAAVIVASIPLFFVLMDKKHWRQNFADKFIVTGLVIGFAGIIFLFEGKGSLNLQSSSQLAGFIVLVVGSLFWAGGSLYAKYAHAEGSTLMKAAVQMMAAGIAAFVAALIAGETHGFAWSNVTASSIYAMLYLVFIGSLIGYIAYIWLLGVRPPALVGTYAYVNPVVAVFLGWLLDNETITMQQIIALLVILAGVLLVNFSKYRKG